MGVSSTQITVAVNNDKTGYSLTAGSYSVRASSMQRGALQPSGASTADATVSSVTTTRALEHKKGGHGESSVGTSNGDGNATWTTITLTSSTNVRAQRNSTTSSTTASWGLEELF